MALGTPPASPNFNAPRYAAGDAANYYDMTNAVTDALDAQAAKRGAIVNADIASNANITKSRLAPLALVDGDVDPAAGIQESKLSLASDAAAGVPSRRSLGVGDQQAASGNDLRFGGVVPIGGQALYSGSGDPVGGTWIIADGRLIDRTQYAAFFAAVGHAYNGGVDPGSNKVKIPDKRGRFSVGAINMGTGAAPNDNAHAQVNRGQQGGESVHVLQASEMPSHGHVLNDPQHLHGTQVILGWGAGSNGLPPWDGVSHAPFGGDYQTTQYSGTGITMQAAGSSQAHNNLGPYQSDSYIVRVA